jgi:hypothetical protein
MDDIVISALGAAIDVFLEDGKGIIVDIEEGKFIVGNKDGYMVLNQCKMNECDDEFKNVKAGTIIKMNEIIQYDSQSEVH